MMYECEHCGYNTTRKLNFTRHTNRKFSCYDTKLGNQNVKDQVKQNSSHEETEVANEETRVANNNKATDYKCDKCNKLFISKLGYSKHVKKCNGVDSLTCSICFKKFENKDQKYKHKKRGKCVAPPDKDKYVCNNTTNYIIGTQNNIQTQNNLNINVFGKEDLSYLLDDKGIIHRLRMYGKEGLYGLPKMLDDVHFNKDRPENQTIIKPEEYGNTVLIKNSNNEWEFREFEDIRESMINTIIKYFRAYNEVKRSLNIDLVEEKERNFIKKISYELMALDGCIPMDLFHELKMDENEVEDDDIALKHKTRKFDKSTMHMIHNRTYCVYKKENGQYIKK